MKCEERNEEMSCATEGEVHGAKVECANAPLADGHWLLAAHGWLRTKVTDRF